MQLELTFEQILATNYTRRELSAASTICPKIDKYFDYLYEHSQGMIHFIRTKKFSEKLKFLAHMTALEMLLFRKIFRAYQEVYNLGKKAYSQVFFKDFVQIFLHGLVCCSFSQT